MTSRDGAPGAEPASAATESQGLASERSVRMRAYHARKHRLRSTPLTADDPRHGAWQRVLARATRTASGCLLWTGAGAKVGRGHEEASMSVDWGVPGPPRDGAAVVPIRRRRG
jgi:hypothetical protein